MQYKGSSIVNLPLELKQLVGKGVIHVLSTHKNYTYITPSIILKAVTAELRKSTQEISVHQTRSTGLTNTYSVSIKC